ncbi:hypothetical protein [Paractinoplanes toevensis]|uniref:Uncharacterized protein n=1 Tax=Paractinoplanes toevensis TaxID=571911 RepID=A0A919T5V1_9ACTN|nr:hypothetical protein [Actinoplanes toevensis]GIM89595.1 hypothetical protein Ato02nite_013880 [Actinoplanes toevensis]
MRDDLDAAVAGLFQAFQDARLSEHVDYCDHCVDAEQVDALRVTPLRQLTPEQLGPFLFNAVTTWGDVAYFRHFLPRLLELVASGAMEDWSYSSFLPGPLARCWTDGTEEERGALSRFLSAWWSATVSHRDSPCRPQDVLEVIDGCGMPAKLYLDAWSNNAGAAAVRHMADFIEDWMLGSSGSARFTAEVDQWLRNDASSVIRDRVTNPALFDELAEVRDLLSFHRDTPMTEFP